jgi:hypothetical protein
MINKSKGTKTMFKPDKYESGKYQLFNDKVSCIIFCEKIGNSRKWHLTQSKSGNNIELGVFNSLSSAVEFCNENESILLGNKEMNQLELELIKNEDMNQSESKIFKIVKDKKILINPDEFYNLIWELEDIESVKKYCLELLKTMSEIMAVTTKSKMLTEYRKVLKKIHDIDSLNEIIKSKDGEIKQHIAVNFLVLNQDEKSKLELKKSNQNSNFNHDGSVKIVENLSLDVSEILDIANRLLDSQNFVDIVIGLLIVTGRRGYEIATKSNCYEDLSIEKSMIILDDYRIAFKGIAKKRESCNAYYKFATLINSKKVFDSFKKISEFEEYKLLINQNNNLYQNSSIRKAISRRFNYLFGDKLSSFNAYESDGSLINEDGSTHKSRAFYSIVIKSIYQKYVNRSVVVNELVQKNLLHDNINETIKYLSKYDGYELLNIPDIILDSNINNLGIMNDDELELLEINDNSNDNEDDNINLDYDYILDNVDSDIRKKIESLYYEGLNINDIFVNILNEKCKNIENKNLDNDDKKPILSVRKNLVLMFEKIDLYNSQQIETDDLIYPTYNLINKLSVKLSGKQLANKTYNDVFLPLENRYIQFFNDRNIAKNDAVRWNSIKHRRDIDVIVDTLISMINKG